MGISKDLTEEDIKFRYINEAITSKGWSKDSIFMEQKVKFTDGKISLHGNQLAYHYTFAWQYLCALHFHCHEHSVLR